MLRVCCCCFVSDQNEEGKQEQANEPEETNTLLNANYDIIPMTSNIIFMMQEEYEFLRKGDTVRVTRSRVNPRKSQYLPVCLVDGGKEVVVPIKCLTELIKIEHEPWYFGDIKDRETAESVLLRADPVDGLFLVRPKDDEQNPYIISVKCLDEDNNEPKIKHYLIYKRDDWYGTENAEKYVTVRRMIEAYMDKSVAILKQPCSKVFALETSRDEIQLGDALGKGNFSVVLKGTWRNRTVAIKQILNVETNRDNFISEANLMHQFKHPKIVDLLGVCTTEQTYIIILEYLSGGSLLTYLHKNDLSYASALSMLVQIVDAMSFLEKYRVLHRDIAARNILKGDGDIVKLSDFGLSRKLEISDYYDMSMNNTNLPILWLAPDAIETQRFTSKSDVWSFAILTMEIFTKGRRPYTMLESQLKGKDAHDRLKLLFVSLKDGKREPKPQNMPQIVYDMLLKCWNWDQTKRPTFRVLQAFFLKMYRDSTDLYSVNE